MVADPDTLKSLPERHFINGLAEAVKAGLIADEGLFELFETEDAHEKIEEIVYRSLVMKKNVVERDEREAGLRATLNFGHTPLKAQTIWAGCTTGNAWRWACCP